MRCSRIRRCGRFRSSARRPIAKYIYETGTRHGKRVQANGGAKNYIVIMPDADVRKLHVEALSTAAFGCAGERCMAGSTAVVVGAAAKTFCRRSSKRRARSKSARPIATRSRTWARSSPRQHRDRVLELDRERREGRREESSPMAAASKSPKRRTDFSSARRSSIRCSTDMTVAQRRNLRPGAERHAHGRSRCRDRDGEPLRLTATAPRSSPAPAKPRANSSTASKPAWSASTSACPRRWRWFPFTGWDESFFGDLHIQGSEGVQFYTQQKVDDEPLVQLRRRRWRSGPRTNNGSIRHLFSG